MSVNITWYGRGSQFPYVFPKDDLELPRKRKVPSHHEEEQAPIEFASKVKEYYHRFLSSS